MTRCYVCRLACHVEKINTVTPTDSQELSTGPRGGSRQGECEGGGPEGRTHTRTFTCLVHKRGESNKAVRENGPQNSGFPHNVQTSVLMCDMSWSSN